MFVKFASQNGVDYYFDQSGVVAVISNQPAYVVAGYYVGKTWKSLQMATKSGYGCSYSASGWSSWDKLCEGGFADLQALVLAAEGSLLIRGVCDDKSVDVARIEMTP